MIRFYLVCLPYWIFVDYVFAYLPANNLRRISTMYVRGYLQGSENGRVVTIDIEYDLDETYKFNLQSSIFNKIYNSLIDQYKYN